MILLIDNYDSFTYNLYQYISEFDKEVHVIRNDAITPDEIRSLHPEAIIISPGPGSPAKAGNCLKIVKELHREFPILGICLGHQVLAEALGGDIKQAKLIKHGKTSSIAIEESQLLHSLGNPIQVMRYHSLIVDSTTLSADYQVTARSLDDNEIMAIEHKQLPLFGMQFHPESIGTKDGKQIIRNFLIQINALQEDENNEAITS
ncbi:anthranilate synthase component II [Oceanobacillus sp. 1P07AA]|uniref:anthranilate synthase component II n=1 Tax=Oceanobacillus sp. 1P07AA TaxID=3132293 RepID=UPI0039A6CDE9